jgi:hypothetical protein
LLSSDLTGLDGWRGAKHESEAQYFKRHWLTTPGSQRPPTEAALQPKDGNSSQHDRQNAHHNHNGSEHEIATHTLKDSSGHASVMCELYRNSAN